MPPESPFEDEDLFDDAQPGQDRLRAGAWPAESKPAETGAQATDSSAPRQRFPSPFDAPPAEKPPQRVAETTRPADRPTPADKPPETIRADRAALDTNPLAAIVPQEASDANVRAMQARAQVRDGQALPNELRQRFEAALADAGRINTARAGQYEQKLVEDLQKSPRTIAGGRVLPPWTEQKEEDFQGRIQAVQRSFAEIPDAARERVGTLEAQLRSTAPSDIARRLQLQNELRREANVQQDPTGKVAAFLATKQQLESFTQNNTDGLLRRNLHQQEMALLHSKTIVSGLYAIALDKAGRPEDRAKIESLVRDTLADRFAVTNLPEILVLREKYGIIEREAVDDKVPGRVALKRAMEIMRDQTQGTPKERLQRAAPLFEQAIGASDQIDVAKTDEDLKKIAKEAAELGEGGDKKRLEELDKQATELLEKLKQPGLARLAYATTLNNVAIGPPLDKDMNERAINYLKAIQQKDAGAKFDPLVQGAIAMASETPPRSIREDLAIEVGKPIVERLRQEARDQGKEEEPPFWRKALGTVADFAIGMAAWYAVSRLWTAGREGPLRNWQAARRINSVEVEATPSLNRGEKPRLVIRDAAGQEREVTGVRREDGRFRVTDGEKTELVSMRRGEKLVLKVAPGANLSTPAVREAAAKVLKPTRTEDAVQGAKTEAEAKLQQRDIELAETRRALEAARTEAGLPAPGARRPTQGDRVNFRGEAHTVAGERGGDVILHRAATDTGAAVAEPVTETELRSKFEEVKVRIGGQEETRYLEKGHPERGLHRITNAAGQTFIAQDSTLTLVPAEQLRSTPAPPAAPATVPSEVSRPSANRLPPERGPAPTADRLQGTDLIVSGDGSLRRETVRIGELISLDRMKRQTELTTDQVRALEVEVERLKASTKQEERTRATELEQTLRALRGEYGQQVRELAHRGIIESSTREMETRRIGTTTITAGVGVAILASAALGWYLAQQHQPQSPLNRSRVSGSGQN